MEVLYKKLYDKYRKLKKQKLVELDPTNDEVEQLFVEYVSAADGLVEQLKLENENLKADVEELRNETALLRSAKDEQYDSFQQSLAEEKLKNRQLSKEIKMLEEKLCSISGRMGTNSEQEGDAYQSTHIPSGDQPSQPETRTTGRKRPRVPASLGAASLSSPCQRRRVTESPLKSLSGEKENITGAVAAPTESFMRIIGVSGACTCIFKSLLESLIGMKVSMDQQTDTLCISALHQSSGYSFRLTWVKKNTELLYQVSALGTLKSVVPDWMKEEIIFSVSMCPLFFERVKRVIKPC